MGGAAPSQSCLEPLSKVYSDHTTGTGGLRPTVFLHMAVSPPASAAGLFLAPSIAMPCWRVRRLGRCSLGTTAQPNNYDNSPPGHLPASDLSGLPTTNKKGP